MKNTVLVTGASGFIGGQTVLNLKDQGYDVIGLDSNKPSPNVERSCKLFMQEDFDCIPLLNIMRSYNIGSIVHCAGTSLVGPSIKNPRVYYENNFVRTKALLDYLVQVQLTDVRFIFSSSAAVYGDPIIVPCQEEDPPMPISPYGESKFMVELMLKAYQKAYGLDYVAFRYFNACGADSQGRHGQAPGATHIIARVLESIRDGKPFTLNGDSYPTEDGSCVRDYVHVEDIANAHIKAINKNVASGVYNLGMNSGVSNRQIIEAAERITGQKLLVVVGEIRPGDPAVLVASADKFERAVGSWRQHNLDSIISHAWAWYQK